MQTTRMRSVRWLACPLLGLLAACFGHGGNPPDQAPPPSSGGSGPIVQDANCDLQYTPTDAPILTGTDPRLSMQWHLDNNGSVGQAGEDLRAFAAWQGTRGEGVRVAVIDDGIEVTHEDLEPNVVANASYNYRNVHRGSAWPLPCTDVDDHGTSVAGLIAARDFNSLGVAGVAPRAGLVGYNALATSSSADVADALNRDLGRNAVYNNSWGSADDGFLHAAEPSFVEAIERGITDGRGGKGAIYVFPSGNGGCFNRARSAEPCARENSNYDGYVNKLGVITACAVDSNGLQPSYGERGANILVCAPSSGDEIDSGITTTTILDEYREDFSGTSASTPMVSGVAALILAVNPELTWRDVRLILAATARRNDFDDAGWSSGFDLNFSHKYGFGVVDAEAAVQRSQGWASVGGTDALLRCGPFAQNVDTTLPDQPGAGTTRQPVTAILAVPGCNIGRIEFVEIAVTADHPSSGDLRIRLISPQGLVSELADERVCYAGTLPRNCGAYNDYRFGSVRHMNEPVMFGANGNWRLEMTDMRSPATGRFTSWSITFYGRR